jgi:hypothetical protein
MSAKNDFSNPNLILGGPQTWFEPKLTLDRVREIFSTAKQEIRIASGFFTLRGWNLIRRFTQNNKVYILVGIDDPGEDRARLALIADIMRDLATGLDADRRQGVIDLVKRIRQGEVRLVDARALDHHAKLYIADRSAAIVASANTTGRGFIEQVEAGTVLLDMVQVENLVQRFDHYFAQALDITQELLAILERWLLMATPWDIYLRTILALENFKPTKHNYSKEPVTYQKDMIAQTLRQIRKYKGAMLVASTGLGKTIVATHVALQLNQAGEISNVMIIGPKVVKHLWAKEMREAGLAHDYFIHQSLDKEGPDLDSSLADFDDIVANNINEQWLVIIDESHTFRNRYTTSMSAVAARSMAPKKRSSAGSSLKVRNSKKGQKERGAFARLLPMVEQSKCKVLLLTGSPYSTSVQNINDQLLLLPHIAPNLSIFEEDGYSMRHWHIERAEDFIGLEVGSQLTTPHVAKYYGQKDEKGIYIAFGEEKRYIPRVVLHQIAFPLPHEQEVSVVLAEHLLETKVKMPLYRKIIETEARIAWSSSPWAMRDLLEHVLDTPNGPNSFEVDFKVSLEKRELVIRPILEKFENLVFEQDLKLQALISILRDLTKAGHKAIIFCERHATVAYLEKAIVQLIPELTPRCFSTITYDKTSKKTSKKIYRPISPTTINEAIEKFAPVANNAQGKHSQTIDVFITTDAYGVGLNLQDAPVVINYDIDWTPIDPVQRAGRILRPWQFARTVEIYTFVPNVSAQADQIIKTEIHQLLQRWRNLITRHGQSQKLIDMPVLPTTAQTEDIYLPDLVSDTTQIRTTAITLEPTQLIAESSDSDISSYYLHTSRFQSNREYAQAILDDIISAKVYDGKDELMYVLIRHDQKYYWAIYNVSKRKLEVPERTEIGLLKLLECNVETPTAFVDGDVIDVHGNECVRLWCKQKEIKPDEVERICSLFLKPEDDGDKLNTYLTPVSVPV